MKPIPIQKAKLSRRNFLIAVGAGSAATVAAVAGRVVSQPKPAAAAKDTDKRRGKGYEETAHVRNYYRTTQV